MMCPLLRIGHYINCKHLKGEFSACLETDCAWWDDTLKLCSVRVLAQFMVGIGVNIHNIAENMPYRMQL